MWLTVHEPDGTERRVEVSAGTFSVGRSGECDLVLADAKASRRHAVIEAQTDGRFTLRDLASANGTAVDGQRIISAVELHDGERITIGATTLTVTEVAPGTGLPPAPTERPTRSRTGVSPPSSESREPRVRSARTPLRRVLLMSAGAAVALLVLALVVAQLTLPGIASSQLRDSLKAHGTIQSVKVEAFPAVTLLWHHASKVTVRMTAYSDPSTASGKASQSGGSSRRLADFLASTSATDSLDARVGRLAVGRLALESVALSKHGPELTASAYASYAAIRAALPSYLQLRSFSPSGGELVFTGVTSLLGQHATVRMRLMASNGALVVQPELGPFLPSVLSLTVFKDPRIIVESVAAQPANGGFDISARARLSGA